MSKRSVLVLIVTGAVVMAATSGAWILMERARRSGPAPSASGGENASHRVAARYYCPMHPTMVSDHPGDCPICQMRMVPLEDDEEPIRGRAAPTERGSSPAPEPLPAPTSQVTGGARSSASASEASGGSSMERSTSHAPADLDGPSSDLSPSLRSGRVKTVYHSTMNPNEVSDTPGKDSMGMEMVPIEVEEGRAASGASPEGLVGVRLSTLKRQLIGVKTSPVVRAPFRRTIRAVARITYDETRERHVSSKIAGYVERLDANAIGALFHKGDPLLEIFSPDLLASQQEYLLARKARERTAGSRLPSVAATGDELVASARRRLELFDVSDEQIQELEATGEPRRRVMLFAPVTGYLTHRAVTQGDKVEIGAHLLDLTDLSRVWALASVYEYELPFVREGQSASMTLSYLPGRTFEGRVTLVYPLLDPATRTAQLRLEFANPGLVLKPDMYANVALVSDLGERLSVPEAAVMDTGVRSIIFVDQGEGFFEPREIEIGLRSPGAYEVLKGVSEGERVLSSGNFFVDSESRLKAALAAAAEPVAGSGHRH